MSQRASFARALVTEPDLLFLDEPFSALDIGLKRELRNYLLERVAGKETTVFFITHDIMEAVYMSDRILLLATGPGRIVKTFEITNPRRERSDEYVYKRTAELLGDGDIIETFELERK